MTRITRESFIVCPLSRDGGAKSSRLNAGKGRPEQCALMPNKGLAMDWWGPPLARTYGLARMTFCALSRSQRQHGCGHDIRSIAARVPPRRHRAGSRHVSWTTPSHTSSTTIRGRGADLQRPLELLPLPRRGARARRTMLLAICDSNPAARYADRRVEFHQAIVYVSRSPSDVLAEELLRHVYGRGRSCKTGSGRHSICNRAAFNARRPKHTCREVVQSQ